MSKKKKSGKVIILENGVEIENRGKFLYAFSKKIFQINSHSHISK